MAPEKFEYEKEQIDTQFYEWIENIAKDGELEYRIQGYIMLAKIKDVIDYAVLWVAGSRFNGDVNRARKFIKDEKLSNIIEFATSYIFMSPFDCNGFMDFMWDEWTNFLNMQ